MFCETHEAERVKQHFRGTLQDFVKEIPVILTFGRCLNEEHQGSCQTATEDTCVKHHCRSLFYKGLQLY